jgi:hypothetical protein
MFAVTVYDQVTPKAALAVNGTNAGFHMAPALPSKETPASHCGTSV